MVMLLIVIIIIINVLKLIINNTFANRIGRVLAFETFTKSLVHYTLLPILLLFNTFSSPFLLTISVGNVSFWVRRVCLLNDHYRNTWQFVECGPRDGRRCGALKSPFGFMKLYYIMPMYTCSYTHNTIYFL